MKKKVISLLRKIDEFEKVDLENLLEIPKEKSNGNFSLPVFIFAKEMKKNPNEICIFLKDKIDKVFCHYDIIKSVVCSGPYVNFFLNFKVLKDEILNQDFSKITTLEKEKILLEWPSPNSNKPLHLGHLRNILLGQVLCNLFEKTGNKIIKVNLNNDRGIAICKSMLMYEHFGENKNPKDENIKDDYFVGKFYEMFEEKNSENSNYENEAKNLLIKYENDDWKTLSLWKILRDWTIDGHRKTYKRFNLKHDKEYFESDIYKIGKEIVMEKFKEGTFQKDKNNNIIINLENKKLGEKVLLRSDGTSIYITQDIALAYEKIKDFGEADKYIFVVGKEQEYHFKVLFEILSILGFGDISKFFHFSYGMIRLKSGKMSSRKGNVIYLDELLDLVFEKSKEVLKKKNFSRSDSENDIEKKAKIISISAINFSILKHNPTEDFIFEIESSLDFIGETGPYILYTYARIRSIVRKSQNGKSEKIQLTKNEENILETISQYSEVLIIAKQKSKPNLICNYLINLCKQINQYYNDEKIIGSLNEEFKIKLLNSTSKVLKDGLNILQIETLDEM